MHSRGAGSANAGGGRDATFLSLSVQMHNCKHIATKTDTHKEAAPLAGMFLQIVMRQIKVDTTRGDHITR